MLRLYHSLCLGCDHREQPPLAELISRTADKSLQSPLYLRAFREFIALMDRVANRYGRKSAFYISWVAFVVVS